MNEAFQETKKLLKSAMPGPAWMVDAWLDPLIERLTAAEEQVKKLKEARTLDEWHEDFGDVLWWKFPVEESPYCGSPLDTDWPDYHTHWTPISVPENVG
ncbi:hypothetical protein [Paenibacillus cucumis (ex Kampfer et al. 2016)]|uniref:DUF551 domain-containing protein n=1 Tax=Paenibacillus cucumis (ex Kampfer et al. 2016) TaxID=1776858 RepID=A0ABS7KMA8_9BACL|nr:hypothetical protein [Paenibacillus cucumis (ex Kampfer et al. 2016)]MBY0205282.1 hypothetical protein [Paenibacillus cucumis (ex Kampfer et al. 2016)]